MIGSFDIHILDPNFMTWSNGYLSCLVLVQPGCDWSVATQKCISIVFSVSTAGL